MSHAKWPPKGTLLRRLKKPTSRRLKSLQPGVMALVSDVNNPIAEGGVMVLPSGELLDNLKFWVEGWEIVAEGEDLSLHGRTTG